MLMSQIIEQLSKISHSLMYMTLFNIPVHDYQRVVHIQSKAVIFLTNLLER